MTFRFRLQIPKEKEFSQLAMSKGISEKALRLLRHECINDERRVRKVLKAKVNEVKDPIALVHEILGDPLQANCINGAFYGALVVE